MWLESWLAESPGRRGRLNGAGSVSFALFFLSLSSSPVVHLHVEKTVAQVRRQIPPFLVLCLRGGFVGC